MILGQDCGSVVELVVCLCETLGLISAILHTDNNSDVLERLSLLILVDGQSLFVPNALHIYFNVSSNFLKAYFYANSMLSFCAIYLILRKRIRVQD